MAVVLVSRQHNLSLSALSDRVASVAPIGLFFGRMANFINAELYGRVTDLPVGIIFPNAGPLPRHPSQLYEAGLEGLILGIVMLVLVRRGAYHKPFYLTGVFAFGYGISRWLVEYAREPDAHIGFISNFGGLGLTMGQLLSLPMIIVGIYLIRKADRS